MVSLKERYLRTDEQQRRWFFLVGGLFLVAIIVVAVILIVPSGGPSKATAFDVSDEDSQAIETTTKDFIQKAGTFGVKDDTVGSETIRNISYILRSGATGEDQFYLSRFEAYNSLLDDIAVDAPLRYDSRDTSTWNPEVEKNQLVSYKVDSVKVDPDSRGTYVTVNGEELESVSADVTFTSTETKRVATSDDSSWDGTYDVLQRTDSESTLRATLVKDGADWKLYSLDNEERPYLLSTWKNPDSADYGTLDRTFSKTGEIKTSLN